MEPLRLAGLLLAASALPGLGLGLALLAGKWNPASFGAAADPARARRATGQLLVAVGAMLALLGAALALGGPALAAAAVPWASGAIVLVATGLAVRVVRASRA